MKTSCVIAFCLAIAGMARAYPRPLEGTENIPKMMAAAAVVCKGEVVAATKPQSTAKLPSTSGTAKVRLDRCFKGSPPREILVAIDSYIPPGGGPVFVLRQGDYQLLFLKGSGGRYQVIDQWFGALQVSRKIAPAAGSGDPMLLLEQDLQAGLSDSNSDLVRDSIRMLGNMRTVRSTVELKALLNSGDLVTQTYVWQALLRLQDYSVLPAVESFMNSQPESPASLFLPRDIIFKMQGELCWEIGGIRNPATLPYLERFAFSNKWCVRDHALQALRQIGSADSAPVYLKALDDPNPDNAFSAMQGLLSLRYVNSKTNWVPTWTEFDKDPKRYAAQTREWWFAEGNKKPAISVSH